MSHPLLAAEAGVRHLLLGNEAIVRGALEAGINVVTCYPGTPSSEIPDTFHYLASCGRYRMEYSVNEKVAVEVGAGAALAGAMSMTTMKHVGVNVAADPLFTAAYVGLPGGFVLVIPARMNRTTVRTPGLWGCPASSPPRRRKPRT